MRRMKRGLVTSANCCGDGLVHLFQKDINKKAVTPNIPHLFSPGVALYINDKWRAGVDQVQSQSFNYGGIMKGLQLCNCKNLTQNEMANMKT